jgi:hypothetical protein
MPSRDTCFINSPTLLINLPVTKRVHRTKFHATAGGPQNLPLSHATAKPPGLSLVPVETVAKGVASDSKRKRNPSYDETDARAWHP